MSELNLLNNGVLQITMVEAGFFKFNIITKSKTFDFDLQCGLNTNSQDFENLVKERIFEVSGLKGINNIK